MTAPRVALAALANVTDMTYALSRLMTTATAGYGVYALVRPGHVPNVLQAEAADRPGLELLAQTYGVRDLAISVRGLLGGTDQAMRTAMLLRIAMDLGDAGLLAPRTDDPDVRRKVLAITLGWAALNTVALAVDSRRAAR